MKPLLALLALLFLGAAAPPPCLQPGPPCSVVDPGSFTLGPGVTEIKRRIAVPANRLPLNRPLTVRIAALASAEVDWNGVPVGRNGIPAASRAAEVPGRYFAMIEIPHALVRPGDNRLTVRLSAEHLWLPVRRPVHLLAVGPYETPTLPGRAHYLPSLLALGVLAVAIAFFAAAAFAGRRERGRLLLTAIAAGAMVQLLLEVSRAYFSYAYPMHLARVSGIAVAAAAVAVLIAAWAATRFWPERRRLLVGAAALAAVVALVLVPWFDLKALGAILAGLVALLAAALRGAVRRLPGAAPAAAFASAAIVLMPVEATVYLDRTWHLLVAAGLILLIVEEVGQLRAARLLARRAAALEERLARAEAAGEPIVRLKHGAGWHRVAAADILCARAADDYCEVRMRDGRELLVTVNLGRLQEALPAHFARVHRSFLVNRDRVERIEARAGGGRLLRLEGGGVVPVGRRYSDAALGGSAAPPGLTPSSSAG